MLTDLGDIASQIAADGRGGRRPGAGRKKADGTNSGTKIIDPGFEVRSPEQLLADGPPPPLVPDEYDGENAVGDVGAIAFTVPANAGALYAGAKARKEAALAAKAELEFRIKAGQYLPRDAVRAAIATSFQSVAQALRSIPDNLERKLGVTPDVAEAVSVSIDETMGDLATELEQVFVRSNELSTTD